MIGTEEDSFDFPEFLEKENCLPASNSSTTSSIFGSLNSAHLLQSTSQQSAEKIQKPEFLKCSNSLHNRGVYAISPIAEEFRGDLDNLVSYVDNLREVLSDEIIQNLTIPLRNLSDNFERQQNELSVNWKDLLLEKAKIAEIHCSLKSYEYKATAGKASDRLTHAKIKKLEGEVNAIAKSSKEGNTKINDYSEILDSSEHENSCVQFVDEPLKLFPSNNCPTFDDMDTLLNEKFELPLEMVNTSYKLTKRGAQFTFSDGKEEIVVTELAGCKYQYCFLYEYPNKLSCENEHSEKHNFKKFRWTTVPQYPKSNSDVNKIEISFLQESFEIFTPQGNYIGFSSDGELSIHWRCNDKTVIRPDGNRYEYYGLELEEIYLASGEAYRSSASKKWRQEKFTPNLDKMNERQDGSYSALHQGAHNKTTSNCSEDSFLQINATDFKLRRFNSTKAVKILIPVDSSFDGASVEIWLCVGNSLVVKHVLTEKGICGQKKRGNFYLKDAFRLENSPNVKYVSYKIIAVQRHK
uniref:Uncharacterized protein n=1 Tax=Meloidogyne javanica TaxID=6303 RepID=A0A915N5M4_MELJA